ncbi:MAG: phosphoribosylamine--glycine ligase [Elainella sp. Prado103]|nr:phosphoribosylamine--glycine ligase [Elainella sp. Prado103]
MKVLVVGSGGREHALAWKLLQSDRIQEVICVPGNGGTATLSRCRNLGLTVDDFEGIGRFSTVNNIGLIVVGPEAPLAAGITDYLHAQGLTVFGPTQAGAQIEASKAWAKALMEEAQVPTAEAAVFTQAKAAIEYVTERGAPIVIKADGLAAGKGVTVATTVSEAIEAIEAALGGAFGAAGQQIVIEECLMGQEASVLAITDGKTIRPLLPAQDHKRIGEGDTGANTGGMGAYAPAPIVTTDLMERIEREILQPTLTALQERGIDYRGVLYAGLMITPAGDPKVIEFNCRLGDPETQVVLPLLQTPLHEVMLACANQTLDRLPPLQWHPGAAACVVIAAPGYPGSYSKGVPIRGIAEAEAQGGLVFHAGTRLKEQQLVSDGGRVLNVSAIDQTLAAALQKAYGAINALQFEGMYFRRDIGHHALQAENL